ncbi:MAG: class II aldolase/adducin family protein [Anaerolineales bacterium]|nr:class II aldolase/adducin family protein [Anaerolineales bacterium]MCK5635466.1 class II aldolase/adducin family protein [Anaerolineales bacterium]
MKYQSIREQILEAIIKAKEVDLIRLSAGNISTRIGKDLVAITPGGVKYNHMKEEDISIVDLEGNFIDGLTPSSETSMHTAIYRNLPEVGGIFHTHSSYAITFAMLGEEIPPANIELFACGAPIPVAPWACPGTQKAGEVTVEIFRARPDLNVLLLCKHGLVAIGKDLNHSFDMALNAEVGFRTYHQALMVGKPQPLTTAQLEELKTAYSKGNING